MENELVKTWLNLILKYPDKNPTELFKMIQTLYNVEYSEIIKAIGDEMDKKHI